MPAPKLLVSRLSVVRFLFTYIAITGFFLTVIIPPFQKTDEINHFYKTVAVATGNFFCSPSSTGPVNTLPAGYVELPEKMMAETVNENIQNRFPRRLLLNAVREPANIQATATEARSCSLPFLFYLPVSLFLIPFIFVGLPPILTFFLGRMIFFLICLGLFRLSLKIIQPQYRLLLLLPMSLPMTLIQMGSYNKEVWFLAFGALSFAFFMRLREKFELNFFAAFVLSLIFFVLPRPLYFPIFLLTLLVLPKSFVQKPSVVKFVPAMLVGTVLLMVASFFFIPPLLQFHSPLVTELGVSSPLQIKYLQLDPMRFINILFSSYVNHIDAYYKSMIGTYGSIHSYLDWFIYTFFGAFIFYVIYFYTKKQPLFRKREIVFISFILFSITYITFFLFYLYATPVGYPWVVDVQGRYFIMMLPYIVLITAAIMRRYREKALFFGMMLVFLFLLKNVYDRYYDYSYGFVHPELPKSAISVPFTEQSKQLLQLDSDKKLMGFTIFIENDDVINLPVLMSIYDSNCHTQLDQIVFLTHTMRESGFASATLHSNLRSISAICYTLEPFGQGSITNTKTIMIKADPSTLEPLALPLYAY